MDNLNLITSDFVFSVSYVPLPAWNVKIFLLRSVFLRQKAGEFSFPNFCRTKGETVLSVASSFTEIDQSFIV